MAWSGAGDVVREYRVEWVKKPAERQQPALGERRSKRVSALTNIAQTYPHRDRFKIDLASIWPEYDGKLVSPANAIGDAYVRWLKTGPKRALRALLESGTL
jgi:hypothetical protein